MAESGILHHSKRLLAVTSVPVPFSGLQMVWLAQLDLLEHCRRLSMHSVMLRFPYTECTASCGATNAL